MEQPQIRGRVYSSQTEDTKPIVAHLSKIHFHTIHKRRPSRSEKKKKKGCKFDRELLMVNVLEHNYEGID